MAIRIDDAARVIELGVHDLLLPIEPDPFAAGRAGLSRLLAGLEAHRSHATLAMASDPAYEREVVVRGEVQVDRFRAAIWGRVDGLLRRSDGGIEVEEVKSVILTEDGLARLAIERYPDYVLQLRIYLWLLARKERGAQLSGRLVFVNLPGQQTRSLAVEADHDAVQVHVETRVRVLLAEHASALERLRRRRELAERIEFPFAERRPGQAEMEAAMGQAFDRGECLLMSAPTGVGKTAAALTAALRHALAHDRRVFYVTSKTTEQRVVADTLARLAAKDPALSAVVLRAKAKICLNDVVACHPEVCEHARDYPAKVQASRVREELLREGLVLPDRVRQAGVSSRACPFQLELDLAARTDVVVGDYNYAFDPAIAILGSDAEVAAFSDLVLVIDEAHNLLDRARGYYSPELDGRAVADLLAFTSVRPGEVMRALSGWLERVLAMLERQYRDTVEAAEAGDAEPLPSLPGRGGRSGAEDVTWVARAGRIDRAIAALRDEIMLLLVDYLVYRRDTGQLTADDPVLDCAYSFLRFARVLDLEGDEFVYLLESRRDPGLDAGGGFGVADAYGADASRAGPGVGAGAGANLRYRVICLDPARQIGRRLRAFHAVVAMSATLEPEGYHRDLLGFPPEKTSSLVLPSPFPRSNRRLLVVPTVSTIYRERARHYDRVAETVAEVASARPGHWMAFFPSFSYLREVEARLPRLGGEVLVQRGLMSEDERQLVLDRLSRPDGTPRLLLAVLGGIFGEGVDLPGEALVGVVVVSPGLPQVSLERELIRVRMEELYGAGFDYAYAVPGLNRVVQAAGRLVRTPTDRGVIVLLDRRFAQPAYSRFFPREWYEESPAELVVKDPAGEIVAFFE